MGLVDPKFWIARGILELFMLKLAVRIFKLAPIDPKTGNKLSKLPMNVNFN